MLEPSPAPAPADISFEQLQETGVGRGEPRPARHVSGHRAQVHLGLVQHLARPSSAGGREDHPRHAGERTGHAVAREVEGGDGVDLLVQVVDETLERPALGIEEQEALRPLAITVRGQQQRHPGPAVGTGDGRGVHQGAGKGEGEGLGGGGEGEEEGEEEENEAPPPKTLITPALFSRPLPTPLTGRRGRPARPLQPGTPLPGRGMGWSGEGQG